MGEATEENLLAALREVVRINAAQGADTAKLASELAELEKRLADAKVDAAQQATDRVTDLLNEQLQGAEQAIAQEMAARDRALRQAGLSEQERQLIVANSETRIAKIKEDARRAESQELLSWTETYFAHEIAMGNATKESLLGALREVQRLNAERGDNTEALVHKIQLLEKELADDTVRASQEAATPRACFGSRPCSCAGIC